MISEAIVSSYRGPPGSLERLSGSFGQDELVELLRGVDAWIDEAPRKRDFLAWIDHEFSPFACELLCERHDDLYYARLLTLKLCNYVVAKYHYRCAHTTLASRPVTLMHDPSNACQLRCPGCVHTANEPFAAPIQWPIGTMRAERFAELLRPIGPFALNTVLFNYGEPLLNKAVADFVLVANGYAMSSQLSTNLSLAFDVERLVAAGPDHVFISIDGISQESYARFRKRGQLDLALDNVRKLVAAKHKLGTHRPILVWRFLTFEHNVDEVDDAIALAEEIGVDEMHVATPFDVSDDDPGVRAVVSERCGKHAFIGAQQNDRRAEDVRRRLLRDPLIDELFEAGWRSRLPAEERDEPARASPATCLWLYFNMTVDAVGRVMPCCIAPTEERNLVYGDLSAPLDSGYSAGAFRRSRAALAGRVRDSGLSPKPYCIRCSGRPDLSYGPHNAIQDLAALDDHSTLFAGDLGAWWSFARWQRQVTGT